jgi:hypothetical protein
MPSLADLKTLVKTYRDDRPKLSAGKDALLTWCATKGLLKKDEPAMPEKAREDPKPVKAPKEKKVVMESELPKELRKPEVVTAKKVEKVSKKVVMEEPVKAVSAKGAFSAFISKHKGSGLSMKELADKYKASKAE